MTPEQLVGEILHAADACGHDGRLFVQTVEAIIEKSGLSAAQIAAAKWEAGARLRAGAAAEFEAEQRRHSRFRTIQGGWRTAEGILRRVKCTRSFRWFAALGDKPARRAGDTIIAAPLLSAEQCDQAGIVLTDDSGRDLLRVIAAQREFCSGRDENGQVLVIGGRIVLTVITADTIGQRVVGELPIPSTALSGSA